MQSDEEKYVAQLTKGMEGVPMEPSPDPVPPLPPSTWGSAVGIGLGLLALVVIGALWFGLWAQHWFYPMLYEVTEGLLALGVVLGLVLLFLLIRSNKTQPAHSEPTDPASPSAP